jgi:transposase-like protein
MLVPRQQYPRELKIACMREMDSGKSLAEIARRYQLSPKRLETWKSEWRAKGELAFPGKGARPEARLDAEQVVRGQQQWTLESPTAITHDPTVLHVFSSVWQSDGNP